MSKDITVVRDVLCGHAQGLSLKKIQEVTGVPKWKISLIGTLFLNYWNGGFLNHWDRDLRCL